MKRKFAIVLYSKKGVQNSELAKEELYKMMALSPHFVV